VPVGGQLDAHALCTGACAAGTILDDRRHGLNRTEPSHGEVGGRAVGQGTAPFPIGQ
jgi:hypothetical protein